MLSASDSDSLEGENENNDSDFSLSSFSNESNMHKKSNRVPSPDPLWLQQIELPPLVLPDSSDDLIIPKQYALKAASIYEVFRRFKQLIRLTPFRLEDFCAAVMSEEQSSLLAEIHIMLLRALLREEDAQGTQFGPQDHKDSINITLYLIDQITWPEVLRCFLESHESFDKSSLDILTVKDYPFVSVEDRLTVLQFLTDQFLITDIVRTDLAREVPIIYDDHCRICHKLGDLVCCETCPAVFHLECVDPPMDNVPAGDYQCNLCKLQQGKWSSVYSSKTCALFFCIITEFPFIPLVPGVYDCVSSLEKQGFLCRHEHLGYDRHGRKFWFINRRIFVEDEESGEIWYYSSVQQFHELLSKLDEDNMERPLCAEIADFTEEIERQMTITETLTNKFKGHKKTYLETENERMKKQKEREERGGDSDTENNKSSKADEAERKSNEKEITSTDKAKTTDDPNESPSRFIAKNVVSTRLKTGSLTPKNYNTDDLKRKLPNKDEDSESRMTRLKNLNLNCPFKLGHEQTFKTYVNQYATNVYALNKPQRNEDRDKKRPLSHKFSLTQASEFKWGGILNGTRNNVITTLRQTLISLEQQISTAFMHPNWPTLKKLWLQAVAHCNRPTDFAKVFVIFYLCTKNCIYVNAWHEQLAHISFERITSAERDEKKKNEKREKRERDDEEERNRLAINFVKYSLGQRHQVAKQKGEEYRIHGQWSWIWMSYGRRQHSNKNKLGERIEPAHIVTQIRHNDIEKIITLEPHTYDYLKTQNECGDSPTSTELHKTTVVPIASTFDGLDVSGALTAENRLIYPKVAKKCALDDLLKRRLQLKTEEEQRIEAATKANGTDAEPAATVPNKPRGRKPTDVEKQLRRLCGIKGATNALNASTSGTQPANVDADYVNEVANTIIIARDKFARLNRMGKQYKCYPTCESNDVSYSLTQMKKNVCYSPLCLQKTRVKEELLIALKKSASHGDAIKEKIMKIVNRQPENKVSFGQTNAADSSSDINPAKLQRSFLHALEKSSASNIERDVGAYMIKSEPEEPKPLKEERNPVKMEVDDGETASEIPTAEEPIKMEIDNEQPQSEPVNNVADNSDKDDEKR